MDDINHKWTGENPWLGLGAYSEGQCLYGRDKEAAALADIVMNHVASVVYGKSGIGKSSLLKAGVFPLLRRQELFPIYLRLAHNSDVSYVGQIENAVRESLQASDLLPGDIPDMGLWDFFHRHRFTDAEGNIVTPVVVLDQFEEIFTLTDVDHKSDVQTLFTELANLLNDVKPDRVIGVEAAYARDTSQPVTSVSGFTLQSLSKSVLHYETSPSFRLVFSLRDDSLFLLERCSAKIPALKVNRYNLRALDEQSALEVIKNPCPGLFSDVEAHAILDGLAYYEYDDYRVVDPAILSLFLYSYYREQGRVSYENIFERYYLESIGGVSSSTIAYLEDELLTDDGYRKRLPCRQLLDKGVSTSEMDFLERCVILKKDREYVEFSHDLLCREALKHKNQRINERNRKRMKALVGSFAAILAVILLGVWILWPKAPTEMVSLHLKINESSAFKSNEHWEVDFRFLSSSKDSVLSLPVQNQAGVPLEKMKAFKGNQNEFTVVMPKEFLEREQTVRVEFYNPTANCYGRIDTIDLSRWASQTSWSLLVERIDKILFAGKIVTEEGKPLEKALVVLGNQPMQETGSDGMFRFFMDDSTSLGKDLYVFRKGYDSEHILGDLLMVCCKGTDLAPLVIPMKSSASRTADIEFEQLFAEQLHATVSLFRLARYEFRKDGITLHHDDSVRLDSVIKVYPQYALNLKKLRRTNKMTADKKLDVYCVSVENPNVKGIRDAVGNCLFEGKDHVFKGKLFEASQGRWRLSAISWDRDNNRYIFQGVFDHMTSGDKNTFVLEVYRPYSP